MPRKRKGDKPQSYRHIRRLAIQETERDIQQIEAEFSSTKDTASTSENRIQVEEQLDNVICVVNSYNDSNVDDATASTSIHEVTTCETFDVNLKLNIDFKKKDFQMDPIEKFVDVENVYCFTDVENDDTFSIPDSDDAYRYSDSDADSIPEEDFNIDNDFNNITDESNENFIDAIRTWALQYQIRQNALKALLSILNDFTDTKLPKDPRTILKTPQSSDVKSMDTGQYCHTGLKNAIKKMIENRLALGDDSNVLKLLINIDGAPITGKSSEKGMWTILIKDYEYKEVYVVGMYYGRNKPEDQNIFLKPLTEEAEKLISNGFIHNKKKFNIIVYAFICDAPAKAFILNTKYPSGYHSCTKCTIEGEYYKAVCFPVQNFGTLVDYCHTHLRIDEKFKNLEYMHEYQKGVTVLNDLPGVGLISNVPLDPMHLVYLGVTRQLIRHWLGNKGRQNKNYKLSHEQITIISDRLEHLSYLLPSDFNRRCRSLTYWKLWKATEFRHFLLYFGAAILKDVLPKYIYEHFLLLHIAILILSTKTLTMQVENIKYAESLLIQFVYSFQNIYGEDSVSFNVHNLVHLAKDVSKYGPLESFSAFPFESYICTLKKYIRKSERPLQQITRRLSEYEYISNIKNRFSFKKSAFADKIHYNGILTDNRQFGSQYKILSIDTWNIDINDVRNNCVMLTDGTIINVLNIAKSNGVLYLIGKRGLIGKDLFVIKNFHSDKLGINVTSETSIVEDFPSNLIKAKVFKIPCERGFITYPILHTLLE